MITEDPSPDPLTQSSPHFQRVPSLILSPPCPLGGVEPRIESIYRGGEHPG